MKSLTDLVDISNFFGRNKSYVIAGGGNTSYKNESHIWVKASGTSLASLTQDSIAVLDRAQLQVIAKKEYSKDVVMREEQVKNDLATATLTKDKRPSVETSIHDIIAYPFVVHLHPTYVNGVTCSYNAQNIINEMFGPEHLFIPYTDPGYTLFKEISLQLEQFRQKFEKEAAVIWLQNHGIFVGGETVDEIRRIYQEVVATIKKQIGNITMLQQEAHEASGFEGEAMLQPLFPQKYFLLRTSGLITQYVGDSNWFSKVSAPFIPDQIVYCKAASLYLTKEMFTNREALTKAVETFQEGHGYLPKVILIQDRGLITVGESEKECGTVADVFEDALKIAAIAENFGGPHPMSHNQVYFIENWEVENYRRKVASTKTYTQPMG